MKKKAVLVLSNGLVFEGESFGAGGEAIGEVVFNTAMAGYQEILTDSSYKGQIVAMTYTQIGNYGVNAEDIESKGGPKAEGFIVKEYLDYPSNWRADGALGSYLNKHGVVGIQGIDTRALTSCLRDAGSMMGIISTDGRYTPAALFERIREHQGIGGIDLVKEVTTERPYKWPASEKAWGYEDSGSNVMPIHQGQLKVVVYDFGVKRNILRNLASEGFDVMVVPAATSSAEVLEMNPDGILLSNGPGDPDAVSYGIQNVRELIGKKPIFGICLGHQILGLALNGRTYKLKFGHHGGNHPVKDIATGKVEITSQNHNYCVDIESLKGQVVLTHTNLYDGTPEGIRHVELPIFSVQYHPEAAPGPNDSNYLFRRFKAIITGGQYEN
ncbi:glutamine-hydrolyzing carbamoyl-phosphate synthase small subunit [Candidatus Magnetominusculus dajiuhuensis]|uniref:glutamine-hydrolyzing carbamoyl-phosphate synthase small subunit n=1 Tax=Candidatus Magnetominusculus dajiuhuensis TaxID=3137712 RepID=UPI003B4382BF